MRVGWLWVALVTASPNLSAYSFSRLVELIESRGVERIVDVLPHLPDELLANYTLVYRSRSVQAGSLQFPRAILFGRDAKFILAFNGHPAQRGYYDLEILQFNDQAREFELYRISFAGGVTYSRRNPPACTGCHGVAPGPIWSSYEYASPDTRHWPGMYGSVHDAPRLDRIEADAFKRFRAQARQHPRYRNLRFAHLESAWFPYGHGAHQHRFRPNNRLGNLLARLNARRIAARIEDRDFLRRYPHTAWLWLLRCPQVNTLDVARHVSDLFTRHADPPARRLVAANDRARMLEHLLSGMGLDSWNLELVGSPADARYSTGIVDIDYLVAGALLADPSPRPRWLGQFYRRWSSRELYDGFQPGYYAANVQPGGVGAVYDEVGAHFDRVLAQRACPRLLAGVQTEMTAR